MATISTYMTIRDAARRLGVHENTMRRYVDRGLVSAVRLPSGVRRVSRDDVERLGGAEVEPQPTPSGFGTDRSTITVAQLIADVEAEPVKDPAELALPDLWDSDEDVERFIAMTATERAHDR